MQPAIELKRKIDAFEVTTGVLATDHVWPMLVEVCQRAGLDYLIVDCEHGPHDDSLVAHVCQVGRLAGFPVLIRTPSTESDVVRRALDMGPCGLMFPCVESAEQLDEAARWVRMPPRGGRRPGGWGNYWMTDYQYETWRREFEEHVIILTQIENTVGLANVDAIARHEIVASLAIGPYDLSASLGCCWDGDSPKLNAAFQRIREAGRAAGKNTWFGMGGKDLVAKGWTFICLGTPGYVLQKALADQAAEAGAGQGGADRSSDDAPVA